MIAVLVAAAVLLACAAVVIAVGVILAKKVVKAVPSRRTLPVTFSNGLVTLPADHRTVADGEYLLRLEEDFSLPPVRVGEVVEVHDGQVVRRVHGPAVERRGAGRGAWIAHKYAGPDEIGPFQVVQVPVADDELREAWLFKGDPTRWVIHVQGIRTSRNVTLRTVAIASEAGATSLTITYRGAGDGPPARAATLGAEEWRELRDAVRFAREHGAKRVTVAAWSMGAALALELLRRDPKAVDDLILICPVSSWPATIQHGAEHAHLPRWTGSLAGLTLRSRAGSRLLGLPEPVDVRALDWTGPSSISVPTLIIHSQGDEVAPWNSSVKLAAGNPRTTTLVETTASPHGFELTVPDPVAQSELYEWLINRH
ncbi:alpha/beta fold hydrolase [Microbacterium sp. VKM Ac-2870]|uniref:alpha/beta hydrolase family protein n=1 Tax=Microbacterium sp. VKM Ac-2870 TaxID=2783825 RepID=UPI00188C98A1|nr:alpha/beta fold hydrolase [Microbacterium sp. VKM Ac-2870]MBF4563375.1 alpha/beta fold hydrolase [Microbacterium sp. VKM Ac-2870]